MLRITFNFHRKILPFSLLSLAFSLFLAKIICYQKVPSNKCVKKDNSNDKHLLSFWFSPIIPLNMFNKRDRIMKFLTTFWTDINRYLSNTVVSGCVLVNLKTLLYTADIPRFVSPLPPLLSPIPCFAICTARLSSFPNLVTLASVEARTFLRKPEPHLEDEEDDGVWLGFDASFLLKALTKGKGASGLWSGPNWCFKQWSRLQPLHLIVLENVRDSATRDEAFLLLCNIVVVWRITITKQFTRLQRSRVKGRKSISLQCWTVQCFPRSENSGVPMQKKLDWAVFYQIER